MGFPGSFLHPLKGELKGYGQFACPVIGELRSELVTEMCMM